MWMCVCSRRSFEQKALDKPAKASGSARSKKSPLYKCRYPAAVPVDGLTQPQMKELLPPSASVWQGTVGSGSWSVHLPPHSRIARAWTIAGHHAAALHLLRAVWQLWLDDNGLLPADCPIAGVF